VLLSKGSSHVQKDLLAVAAKNGWLMQEIVSYREALDKAVSARTGASGDSGSRDRDPTAATVAK
jgi:hypothetical protein